MRVAGWSNEECLSAQQQRLSKNHQREQRKKISSEQVATLRRSSLFAESNTTFPSSTPAELPTKFTNQELGKTVYKLSLSFRLTERSLARVKPKCNSGVARDQNSFSALRSSCLYTRRRLCSVTLCTTTEQEDRVCV